MIKHIVMWSLKSTGEQKIADGQRLKQLLESLNGKIPGMLRLEVGVNFYPEEDATDLVLYSEFESRQALDSYMINPAHTAIQPLIKTLRNERRIIDYEV